MSIPCRLCDAGSINHMACLLHLSGCKFTPSKFSKALLFNVDIHDWQFATAARVQCICVCLLLALCTAKRSHVVLLTSMEQLSREAAVRQTIAVLCIPCSANFATIRLAAADLILGMTLCPGVFCALRVSR